MITHDAALDLIDAQTLTEEDQAALQAHLEGCADCRTVYDAERRLKAAFVAERRLHPSRELHAALLAVPRRQNARAGMGLLWIPLAAAVTVAVGLGIAWRATPDRLASWLARATVVVPRPIGVDAAPTPQLAQVPRVPAAAWTSGAPSPAAPVPAGGAVASNPARSAGANGAPSAGSPTPTSAQLAYAPPDDGRRRAHPTDVPAPSPEADETGPIRRGAAPVNPGQPGPPDQPTIEPAPTQGPVDPTPDPGGQRPGPQPTGLPGLPPTPNPGIAPPRPTPDPSATLPVLPPPALPATPQPTASPAATATASPTASPTPTARAAAPPSPTPTP